MKQFKKLLCLVLSLLLLTGCAAPAGETAAATEDTETLQATSHLEETLAQIHALGQSPDDNYRTWYEIFVYSFCDSDGDGIGDLKGVESRLDYLQELGITGIWLMPVHPSQSYHKYDVRDYYAIDPDYGTLEDMESLLAACEARGIKVIMDLVLNHTGDDHEWFLTAADYLRSLPAGAEPNGEECPYVDYYFFTREPSGGYNQIPDSDWYYESIFSPDMPDLNHANPQVRQEITAIMEFWLGKGAHGFRLDAVKEFYTGDAPANIEVLAWLQETATSIKSDAYLVGEAWEGFNTLAPYYTSGMTSFFDFPFANSDGKIVQVLRAAGNEATVKTYATALQKAHAAYSAGNPNYIDAPFLSNHDVGRIAGFVGRDENKTKLAGAMNIFMSGSCFIYYGEEIGMVGAGNDPSKRAPMYWNTARDNGTTNPPPECELPSEYPFGSLEEQKGNELSIYNYYRQAIAIRNSLPAMARGAATEETALNIGCVSAYRKTCDLGSCIVLMNISPEAAQADLSSYGDWTLAAILSADGNPITLEGSTLNLPAYGTAVLIPKA